MNRIIALITSGRAFEKVLQVLVTTIPALVVGLVLLVGFFAAMKSFRKKGQEDNIQKLVSAAPYLYFLFVAVLWMSHNGILPVMKVDFSFALTPAHLFYFVTDLCVFLILGFLFGRIKENRAASMVFCAVAALALELVQYLCRFGTLSAVQLLGMILGAAIGIAVGAAARKKAAKKTVQQTV